MNRAAECPISITEENGDSALIVPTERLIAVTVVVGSDQIELRISVEIREGQAPHALVGLVADWRRKRATHLLDEDGHQGPRGGCVVVAVSNSEIGTAVAVHIAD